MPRVAGGSYGEWIEGVIQTKSNKVRLVPNDSDRKPLIFSKSNCPDGIVPGEYLVQISDDEKSILNHRPLNGQFKLKFVKFAGKDGEKPTPKAKSGKGGGEYFTFTPILEIVDGDYEGLQFPYTLYYKFDEVEIDGKACAAVKGSGTGADKVIEFLELTGIDDHAPFPWRDNLLPGFEKIALRENRRFLGVAKKGWIAMLMAGGISKPTSDDSDDFEADVPDEEE